MNNTGARSVFFIVLGTIVAVLAIYLAITLALGLGAIILKLTRTAMLRELEADYVTSARLGALAGALDRRSSRRPERAARHRRGGEPLAE